MFALASALFASLTAIIAKIAMLNIDSNLGTFIRTAVVLIMAWGIVFYQQSYHTIKEITKKNWLFYFLLELQQVYHGSVIIKRCN